MATMWTCPGCLHQEELPTLFAGILACSACERYAINLDMVTRKEASAPPVPCDPPNTAPVLLSDGCAGCTPKEQKEFAARFPELDVIDRKFRSS